MSTRHSSSMLKPGYAFARAAVAWLNTAWARRRLVGQLGALDDYMLRDIGISRQDLFSVLAEPMFSDPSLRLAERAQEARAAARASARDALAFERSPDGDAGSRAETGSRPDRRAA